MEVTNTKKIKTLSDLVANANFVQMGPPRRTFCAGCWRLGRTRLTESRFLLLG